MASVRELLSVTKALSDGNRIRVLLALRRRELCVCQIAEFLKLAPSTVSKHMSILKQACLVDSRKEGRWVFYKRIQGDGPAVAENALSWIDSSLRRDTTVRDDEKRLTQILKMPVEELCSRYARS